VSTAGEIVEAALAARTVDDARKVDELIAAEVGQRFERPVGDKVNSSSCNSYWDGWRNG
jgi:hypothetical protein